MKKTLRFWAALLLPLLLFSGCIDVSSLVPETEKTTQANADATSSTEFPLAVISPAQPNQTFGVGYVPGEVIDPFETDSEINVQLGHLLYDRLFTVSEDGTVAPGICQTITTEDRKTYELTLRPDLKMHNGDPLTAQDVAYSLRRAQNSTLYAIQLAPIASVAADASANTLTINLSYPLGSLTALLDFPIVSSNTAATYGYEDYALLGSGRYYIDYEVLEGTKYTYLQYHSGWYGYGGDRPTLARIDLFTVADKEELLRRYFNSDIDILSLASSENDPIALHGEAERREVTGGNLFFIGFNTRFDGFASANGRLGIGYLFDTAAIAEAVNKEGLYPVRYPVRAENRVTTYFEKQESAEGQAVNPYQYLRMAGFSDNGYRIRYGGAPYTLTLLTCSDSDMMVSMADAVADVLEKATFTVEIRAVPYKDYIRALYNGNYSLYIGMTRPAENYDYTYLIQNANLFATLWRRVSRSDATPRGAGVSEEVQEALKGIRALDNTDPLYALDLSQAITALFDDHMPFVPLCFDKDTVYLRGSFVGNVKVTSHDIFFNIDSWETP